MESGDGFRADDGWFFDRPSSPADADRLAAEVSVWLRSEQLRWLLENVPGRRAPAAPPEPLEWPAGLAEPGPGSGRARLASTLELLGGICNWSQPGTAWDFRPSGGERPLAVDEPDEAGGPAVAGDSADDAVTAAPDPAAVAERATALGLRSPGLPRSEPRTFVVLGGRRAAPLNRARAAAEAIRSSPPSRVPPRVLFLCTDRPLDATERASPEVGGYAPSARTEVELMAAAAARVYDADIGRGSRPAPSSLAEVRLVEAPSDDRGRASTYDTLGAVADELGADGGSVALVTSPTCRPFQYLDAVRALGLGAGLSCEVIAHPPAWAADPGAPFARPQVYLQEIRSAIQAAGRLARDLPAE